MQKNEKKLKLKYLAQIEGPILFTAPHSKKLYRGGTLFGEKRRIHLRELHTSYLAVEFARNIPKYIKTKAATGSFCIWGKSSVLDDNDLDPNYLLEKLYPSSPFHQSLHEFQAANKDTPLFHVDIHGKYDREQCCELDVGVLSMVLLWKQDDMSKHIQEFMKTHFDLLFKGIKLGKFQPVTNVNPNLHGYWGTEVATMTTQAIQLGIPSVQFQIPRRMRDLLSKSVQLREGFLRVIGQTYNKVIVPGWQRKKYPLRLDVGLLGRLNVVKYNKEEMEQLVKELEMMERSAQSNLQVKQI